MDEHKTGCLICGKELIYYDKVLQLKCFYCGKIYDANEKCVNNHYVCNSCHSLPAEDLIEGICIASTSVNPIELIISLMKSPKIKMHGPEHHFLVPAVLLTCYYNHLKEPDKKEEKIKIARKRAAKVPGGFCGFYGNCGAAVGTGIFISIITEATPLSKNEWKLSNLVTSKSLYSIAMHGGPRCCKRDSLLAIEEGINFLKEHFDVHLPFNINIKCDFSSVNKECTKEECPYYNLLEDAPKVEIISE
jgi:predicted RNA-binding Zn-ribbon protein involved in translation (DUF1610 family)